MSFWKKFFGRPPAIGIPETTAVNAVLTPEQRAAVFDAVENSDLEGLKRMLKSVPGVISVKDKYGRTALHIAAGKKHRDIVEVLLTSGADVNGLDDEGTTPLYAATDCGSLLTVAQRFSRSFKP